MTDKTVVRVTLDLTIEPLSKKKLIAHAKEMECSVDDLDTTVPESAWFADIIAGILASPIGDELVFEGTDQFVRITACNKTTRRD